MIKPKKVLEIKDILPLRLAKIVDTTQPIMIARTVLSLEDVPSFLKATNTLVESIMVGIQIAGNIGPSTWFKAVKYPQNMGSAAKPPRIKTLSIKEKYSFSLKKDFVVDCLWSLLDIDNLYHNIFSASNHFFFTQLAARKGCKFSLY